MHELFCPNAVAWGDVGTWVAGLGTVGTVIAALWLARREGRQRDKERAEQLAMNDFRASVRLMPVFTHLAAVAAVLPERIQKLKARYPNSLHEAEELLELDSIKQMREMADFERMITKDLAVPVLSTFAWCQLFERAFADGFVRSRELTLSTERRPILVDVFSITNETTTRQQLLLAASAMKGYADRAVEHMRSLVEADVGLPEELFDRILPAPTRN